LDWPSGGRSREKKSLGKKGLHIPASVGDEEDDDFVSQDPVDQAVGLEGQLADIP
jgi:hypothetical protein